MNPETPIRKIRFSGIDFESAGASRGRTDTPVQIGLASWTAEGGVHDPHVSYLRSNQPITWAARKVHGIRTEDLADAPLLLELWPLIRERMDDAAVVAHGKGTEKRFLRAFPGNGFGPWVDTLLLARSAWPDLPDHSLGALCQSRNLEEAVRRQVPSRSWHDALFDTVASLLLLEDVINTFELGERPIAELISPDTSEWRRKRAR